MCSVDIPEAKRHVKQKERQAHQERAVEKKKKKSEEAGEQLRRRALDFEEQLDVDDSYCSFNKCRDYNKRGHHIGDQSQQGKKGSGYSDGQN